MSYFRLGREFGFRAGFQFDVGLALERDHHFPEILASTFLFLQKCLCQEGPCHIFASAVNSDLGLDFNLMLGWRLSATIISQKFSTQHFVCSSVSARSVLEFRCGFQLDFGLELERDHHFPEILASTFLFL